MSLSPSGADPDGSLFSYRRGWSAINTLLDKGASLSGGERHCAYLNLGDGTFADVSSAAGIDFPDDGRSLALGDWDCDGDTDLFFTNRTAPRLRFLLNESRGDNRFVAIKLTGTRCNRDAIGARLELAVRDGAEARTSVATVRAGDGFLAQSSKWVHFGLGAATGIEKLTVRWPGGDVEQHPLPEANAFYTLTQGGAPERWTPPGKPKLQPSPFTPPPAEESIRVFMPARVPMPNARWTDLDGAGHDLVGGGGGPRLVNLWAAWCAPCLAELAEWTAAAEQLRALGLDIVALAVDGIDDDGRSTEADARAKIAELGFPFRAGFADEPLLERMEIVADALIDKHNSLPVPTSFLLDAQGEVAAIYKGKVALEQLARDVRALAAPPGDWRFFATPFRGRWIQSPPQASPSELVTNFVTLGDTADAEDYLARWVEARAPTPGRDGQVAEAYYAVAGAYRSAGDLPAAIANYREALKYSPRQPSIHTDLGIALVQTKRPDLAIPHFSSAVASNPNDVDTRRRLVLAMVSARRAADALPHLEALLAGAPDDPTGQLLYAKSLKSHGRAADAVTAYRRALDLQPGWPLAANELAWTLATHPDESVRDGAEALRLAKIADAATGGSEPAVLDTLAAAQAEAGLLDEAKATAARAIELAEAKGQTGLASLLKTRRAAYESGAAFREGTDR